jgi:TolB-like protein
MQQDETFTCGRFKMRRRRRELVVDDKQVELGSRAFDILLALIDADGAVVTKSELMDRVWPGTAVEESNLSVQIHALRRALGEDRQLIQTVAGRGYRFVGELRIAASVEANTEAVPPLSIVVLPFTNLSDAAEQQYFADGITEDLTTDLSRLADMNVISRQTAFVYRTKPADMRQIGRELRVRYVLDGSVRRIGHRIRVNAQLIDAETDIHLWADWFDGDADDLFILQNEITSRIAISLDLELARAEADRPSIRPDALDYIRRGRALYLGRVPTRKSHAEQIALFERALELDPTSMKAQCFLAAALTSRVMDQMTEWADADIARAEELASQALAAFPSRALPHFAKAQVLRARHRPEDAIPEYETVIALNRNWVSAIAALGFCRLMTGSIEEAMLAQKRAIRLDPRGPLIWLYYFWIGQIQLLQSHVEEAIPWLEKARSANPEQPLPHAYLASSYALRGEIERAQVEIGEARRLSGDDRYATITRLRSVGFFGVPKIRALFEATYFVGLGRAGMPD